ncbi:MAG: cytochrome-c oxidase, cbb3-type subunit III [Pseudomonadota bacterium]
MSQDQKTNEIDEITGIETTGHEWDGLKELNNPLPRWWLWIFYGTVIWGLAYTVAYPAWPMISQATQGVLGYDSRAEVAERIAEADLAKQPFRDRMAELDFAQIQADTDLMRFAQLSGAATFRTYCSQCHGAGGAGFPGYANLTDDAWLWGGTIEDIHLTIKHGIRVEEDYDSRFGEMPAFGRDEILEDDAIAQVVEYVLQISDQGHDAALAGPGAEVFEIECSSCHGEDAKGLIELGAPNLTDPIWLYGGTREILMETLVNGRAGMMPAWTGRLSEAQIREVALYVHAALGGGE